MTVNLYQIHIRTKPEKEYSKHNDIYFLVESEEEPAISIGELEKCSMVWKEPNDHYRMLK